jgi:DNA repair exonuclease SbcCD ATPase subunit
VSGLYQRALFFLNQNELISQKLPDIDENEKSSGISSEEQKEILVQIENLVSKNKIAITDESFVLKANKNGIFLPALINVCAVAVIVAAFFFFQFVSLTQEKKIYLDASSTAGILDSQVISSMKKASEEQLTAKEQEISQIQNQLKSLDQEKNLLASNVEKQVADKKAELVKQMALELDKQRQDLLNQGISTENIDAQIADIKKQKEIEFNKSFEAFRSQAEAQRIEDEKKLSSLQDSFSKNLASLNTEKLSLQDQIKSQKTQLDDLQKKNAERENQLTAEKKDAESRLKEMTDIRDREQLINDQITGSYNKIMASMKDGNYVAAQKNIDEIKNYFKDPQVVALPGILKRRDTELFIIDSLTNLIQNNISKQEFDSTGILQKAGLITSISKKVEEADALYGRKDFDGAKKLYDEALAIIPEVRKSYSQAGSIDLANMDAKFASLKSAGDSFYKTRNYSSALDQYTKALKAYPVNQAQIDEVVARIVEAGSQIGGNIVSNTDDERAASTIINRAQVNANAGKYAEAVDAYVELISRYPRTSYVQTAVGGISQTVTKERASLLAGQDTASASKNAMIAERDAAIAQLNVLIEKNNAALTVKDKQIRELTATLEKNASNPSVSGTSISDANAEISKYQAQIKERDATIARLSATLEKSDSGTKEKDTLISQLSAENDKYKSLLKEKDTTIASLNSAIDKGKTTTGDKDTIVVQLNAEIEKYKSLVKEKDSTITQLNTTIANAKKASDADQLELSRLKIVETDLNKKVSQLEQDKIGLGRELASFREKSPTTGTPEPANVTGTTPLPETTTGPGPTIQVSEDIATEYAAIKAKIEELKKSYADFAKKEDSLLKDQGSLGYLTSKPLLGEMLNSQVARELFPDLYERIKRFDTALSKDERTYGREKGIEETIDVINNRLLLAKEKKPDDFWKLVRQSHKGDDSFLELVDMLQDIMEKK